MCCADTTGGRRESEAFSWYADIAGEYPLSQGQINSLQGFQQAMQRAGIALLATAVSELVVSISQVRSHALWLLLHSLRMSMQTEIAACAFCTWSSQPDQSWLRQGATWAAWSWA